MTTLPEPPAPSRRKMIAGLIALVLAAVVIVAGSALAMRKSWERSHPGDFKADPVYCELLTPETVHRLAPTSYGGRADTSSCTWAAPRAERPSGAGIHLLALRSNEKVSHAEVRRERTNLLGWEKDTVADVPGVGDEAFIRFSAPEGRAEIRAQVVFRRSNVVVYLSYKRADTDREAVRAGAIDAAREAAGRLKSATR
ncbi:MULTISPECIES: hypothetical protein [unclassified Streptomyces]|uniref:hypothetical protein n=1 Tax=unclassified Streptomyces TaxID=2593676 RepID=UPI001BEA4DAF|nr:MULTISPECIES: hypothetical protein [unclassified Streptomyces]MBT2404913.1 hypothetical protein [Streptomyces sp. ISL-21]MBT2455971.1 hypothetical protein [Streptomyces sp. ISL-86]MBT2611358.1 hypothetical protein [Streptomyces sp. ISL-87]